MWPAGPVAAGNLDLAMWAWFSSWRGMGKGGVSWKLGEKLG